MLAASPTGFGSSLVSKAAPNRSPSSSANAPNCLRSFLFLVLLRPCRVGERLRPLASDWSLSLASASRLSVSRKLPSLAGARATGAIDAGSVVRSAEDMLCVLGGGSKAPVKLFRKVEVREQRWKVRRPKMIRRP